MTEAEALVARALHMISPRPNFFEELLRSLQETPLLLVPVNDTRGDRVHRIRVAGSVAAGAGVAGATAYTIVRQLRRKGAR